MTLSPNFSAVPQCLVDGGRVMAWHEAQATRVLFRLVWIERCYPFARRTHRLAPLLPLSGLQSSQIQRTLKRCGFGARGPGET